MTKKITLSIVLALSFLLAATVNAAPEVNYVFYDDIAETCYVFGSFDEASEDAGIYLEGDYLKSGKYSLVKDGNTANLDKANSMASPAFGMALKASENVLKRFSAVPYTVSDGEETLGEEVCFDIESNALRENCLYFEDFSYDSEGEWEMPAELTLNKSKDGKVEHVQALDKDGATANMLKLTDPEGSGIYSGVNLKVPEYDRILTFEIRIKMVRTATDGFGFRMFFKDSNGVGPFEITKYSAKNDVFVFANSKGLTNLCGDVDMNSEWFTIKVRMDSSLQVSEVALYSDAYNETVSGLDTRSNSYIWQDTSEGKVASYNHTWVNEYEGGNIDNITLQTYGGSSGEYYIDYIALYEDESREDYLPIKTRAEGMEIKSFPDPVMRLVPHRTNILINGEVIYFANPPIVADGCALVDIEKLAELINFKFSQNSEDYILQSNAYQLIFAKNQFTFMVNGVENTLETACILSNDVFYVPFADIAKLLGLDYNIVLNEGI